MTGIRTASLLGLSMFLTGMTPYANADVIVSMTSSKDVSAYAQNPDDKGYQYTYNRTEVKSHLNNAAGTSRKAYYQFDLGDLPEDQPAVDSASLTFVVHDTTLGTSTPDKVWTFSVYGLISGDDSWDESELSWNNAPGNDDTSGNGLIAEDTVLLGQFDLVGHGTPGQTGVIQGEALASFLANQRQSTGLATFIIVRDTLPETSDESVVHRFGAQNSSQYKPTLEMNIVPEPTSMSILLFAGSAVLMGRRKTLVD